MRLTSIAARNLFRRIGFTHQLDPVTVFVGRNESGKTTRLSLLELLLNGPAGPNYPLLGTSPDYPWVVTANWDDGTQVTREMVGGTHNLSFNGSRSGGLKGTQSRLTDHLGRAATWSLDDFENVTGPKRLAFLEGDVLQGVGWTVEETRKRIEAAIVPMTWDELLLLAPPTPVAAPWSDKRPPHAWPLKGEDGRKALVDLMTALRAHEAAANSQALQLSAAVKVDDAADLASDLPPGTVAQWEETRATLDRSLGDYRERRGRVAAEKTLRDELEGQATEINAELADHRAKDFGALVTAADEAVTVAVAARDKAAAEEKAATEAFNAAKNALQSVDAEHRAASGRHAAAAAELASSMAVYEAMATQVPKLEALRSAIDIAIEGLLKAHPGDEAAGVAAELRFRFGVLIEASVVPNAEPVAALKLEVDGLATRLGAATRTLAAANTALSGATQRLARAESVVSDAVSAHRQAVDHRRSAKATEEAMVRRLEANSAKLLEVGAGDTSALDLAITTAEGNRKTAQVNINKLNDAAGERAQRTQRKADLQAAQSRRSDMRRALSLLSPVLEAMLAETVGPFTSAITRITERVLGASFEVSLEGGFSWRLDRQGVDIGPGSKSANAVACLALRLAVIEKLGGFRCLVLDDMENLEKERRYAFLEAMVEQAKSGRLDTFIGGWMIDPDEEPRVPDGVRVVNLNHNQ